MTHANTSHEIKRHVQASDKFLTMSSRQVEYLHAPLTIMDAKKHSATKQHVVATKDNSDVGIEQKKTNNKK